ncbi:hypothetical protein MLD38_008958 [Melastoma candidum]|uniref:Uncharacterized protein n=1 Tax=Melastoma candidum TaxID=119954 RepID=A0ACB9RXF6_9MYRT|nr:hypothetical protein MLD38_008958 [Melastoma candidum]
MFPLHQGGELLLRFSSDNDQPGGSQPHLPVGHPPFDSTNSTAGSASGMNHKACSRKLRGYVDKLVADSEAGGDPADRKRRHREVEKERRKEMAWLYSDLRSKLPQELRKRSTSDLMNEARNYISCMQSKVRDLYLRRDELKRIQDSSSLDCYLRNDTDVEVRSWEGGLQVMISRERRILASKALNVLSELDGLTVVSCIQTKANSTMLLTIHCEADSVDSKFDIPRIKRNLKEAMDCEGRRLCNEFNLGMDISAS